MFLTIQLIVTMANCKKVLRSVHMKADAKGTACDEKRKNKAEKLFTPKAESIKKRQSAKFFAHSGNIS